MGELKVGAMAPDFTLLNDEGVEVSLHDYKGQNVILYFYPKDSTPGCTVEAQGFNDVHAKLLKAGYVVLGVSRDSVKRHVNFKEKYSLQFNLLADTDEVVCKLYDVLKPKKLYGKEYIGVERSTFIIDKKGKLTHVYRNVKAKVHVGEVLADLGL